MKTAYKRLNRDHRIEIEKLIAFTHYENQNSTKLLSKFNFIKSIETDKENPDLNIFTLTQ